ncbi:hypothetical protein [Apibacter adventoris]|uniref:Uncharacterized protein n=1 Tax=Apibacter adventoris TaxID=1679466 RepID=A0A2S8A887_9FLAO|nr:hypothetical protein [Apibacter adventoris]PQL90740.1 hypothetical protein C4S77_09795 [Apibacter adventoris]
MSEKILPFKNLDIFLKVDIYKKLKSFYKSFENEYDGCRIKNINKKTHQIVFYRDCYKEGESEFDILTFENHIKYILLEYIQTSIDNLEILFRNNFDNKDKIQQLVDFYYIQINKIFNENLINKLTFLNKYKNILQEELAQYATSKYSVPSPTTYLSYVLLAETPEKQIKIIKKLYNLLIKEPALIEATEEEFINSFTGREVTIGIKWLVLAPKNKMVTTNKPSLIYFIRALIDNKFLSPSYYSNENKLLIYVFRDNNGKSFTSQRISSSKTDMSKNPAESNRIDNIIYSLEEID